MAERNVDRMADFLPVDVSGVRIELDQEGDEVHIVFPAYLMRKANKELAVRELVKDGGVYEVPKNQSYIAYTTKLRSGHKVQLQVYAAAKPEQRLAVFNEAIASGKKVIPLDSQVKQRRYAETDGATDTGVKAEDLQAKSETKRVRLA